jgi:putative heme-binding domain-containing protein
MALVGGFILALGFLQTGEGGNDNLSALVEVLRQVDDPDVQLDILKGIRDGLKGRTNLRMPAGWSEVAARLSKSPKAEVRSLAQAVGTALGDPKALEALRGVLSDPKADSAARAAALETLLNAHDSGLAPVLQGLLKDPALRGAALRALGAYEDPKTTAAILEVYPLLDVAERRDALNTLVSRLASAREVVAAFGKKIVPKADFTAAIIRQLGDHHDAALDQWIGKEWGLVRPTPEARNREIADMKKKLLASSKGDPPRGRAVFAKTCKQCHTLFDEGGKVGPEITGANRSDLDYLLTNIMDPSAVVGADYMATVIRTKNGRVLTGIIKQEDPNTITLATENDTIIIPTGDVDARKKSEISMMPEGLLQNLPFGEARDLIAYLMSPTQVPLGVLLPEKVQLFNGKDLAGWVGDPAVWSVDQGEIVGKGALKRNSFLFHTSEQSDFRLIVELKLVPDSGNSGIQFRSVPIEGGEARGCQADVGAGWWGKLYEESARGVIYPPKGVEFDGGKFVHPGEWNTYEILAVGPKIKTALNGHVCTDLEDEKVDRKGRLGLQVHSGGMMEVRFRNFQLELNPKFELRTVK